MLPWWAGVALAVVSYFILHKLAIPEAQVLAPATVAEIGQQASTMLWRTFVHIGQFVLPLLCLFGAAASAIKRYKRRSLIA